MTEPREFCESCQRWLVHNMRFCPLFPDIDPGTDFGYGPGAKQLEKWDGCICLIHTCYDASRRKPMSRHEQREIKEQLDALDAVAGPIS